MEKRMRFALWRSAEGEKKKGSIRNDRGRMEMLCTQLLFAALGALTGAAELLFAVRPFGVALAAGATGFFPAVALGAAAFYLFSRDYVSLLAVGLLTLARLAMVAYPRNGTRNR